MGLVQWIVVAVALQRLGELALSQRNQKCLLAQGGHEVGGRHYPLIVLLHAAWLAALFFGVPTNASVSWILLAMFVVLQGLRVWVIASLGRYWTTRVIALPNAPLSKRGPYRWLRHPNYLIVGAEIAVLPLAFGAWEIAFLFSLANGGLLAWRIRIENSVLDEPNIPGNSH
ncbi:MAG: hypothetical protein KAJ11_16530 [Alphaproteobacteria bacterium]|nr:hypothetical protein [Alphaproteobacteria bacterium]